MARPTTSILADQVYREALPLAYEDEQRGWPLLYFVESISRTAKEIEDLARDTDDYPGWSLAVDIDRAPARLLDWLAQFIGVGPNRGLAEAAYRQRIRDAEGMKRGTPASLIGAAQTHLTGGKRVVLREREGGAYKLTLVTYTSETPDAARVLAAVLRVKPAGLVLTHLVLTGWTVGEMEAYFASTVNTITQAETEFSSLTNFESRIP